MKVAARHVAGRSHPSCRQSLCGDVLVDEPQDALQVIFLGIDLNGAAGRIPSHFFTNRVERRDRKFADAFRRRTLAMLKQRRIDLHPDGDVSSLG